LIAVRIKSSKTPNPIVCCVANIRPVHPICLGANVSVLLQERPVAAVVIDVWVAKPHDANRPVVFDGNVEPFPRSVRLVNALELFGHQRDKLVVWQLVVWKFWKFQAAVRQYFILSFWVVCVVPVRFGHRQIVNHSPLFGYFQIAKNS